MINKKEDLIGTYVKTSDKELLKLYIENCINFGFGLSPAFSDGKLLDDNSMYVAVGIDDKNVWVVSQMYEVMKRELTMRDLIPQTKEVEWEDGLPPVGEECWINFKVTHPQKCKIKYIGDRVCVYEEESGNEYSILLSEVTFSKLETPESKKEREELESAYQLQLKCAFAAGMSFESFKDDSNVVKFWLKIVRETGYRVEE